MAKSTQKPLIADLEATPPVECPCGQARRAFLVPGNSAASIHLVDIKIDPEVHYHEQHTEIYYVLEGEGLIELDGEKSPVKPGTAILIPPGVRHRTLGRIRLLNVPIPPFDPADEHFY
ncbi:MAG: cupin domain-containing protein [Spirochaetaceae bacterium]|nr:MAG: cupin domain-containing protein [Spirochaetaceae bacterium]